MLLSLPFHVKLSFPASHQQCVMASLLIDVLGHNRRPVGGIIYLRETQELVRGFENVTRAPNDNGVSRKWEKFKFKVNYPVPKQICPDSIAAHLAEELTC